MRRRVLAAALLLLMLMLPGCSSQERPEGIVERWLLALNQGAAGEPERYTSDLYSERVLPDWSSKEPGQLDVIEVGPATRTGCSRVVPFRVVRLDGDEIRGFATFQLCPTAFPKPIGIVEFGGVPVGTFPSEGGSPVGTDRPVIWVIAGASGVVLLAVGEMLMRLARRRRAD